jgi:hypothetical protein
MFVKFKLPSVCDATEVQYRIFLHECNGSVCIARAIMQSGGARRIALCVDRSITLFALSLCLSVSLSLCLSVSLSLCLSNNMKCRDLRATSRVDPVDPVDPVDMMSAIDKSR